MCSIKVILENLTKFIGKHLCWSLFFNEVAGLIDLRPATLLKKTLTQIFSCEFYEIFRNNLFYRTHLGDCFRGMCSFLVCICVLHLFFIRSPLI